MSDATALPAESQPLDILKQSYFNSYIHKFQVSMSDKDQGVTTGARPKRSSLKNWPPPIEVIASSNRDQCCKTDFGLTQLESIKE